MAVRAGENGMTKLEYIGGNIGTESWWGPTTSIRYEFGGSKRIGYVDNRDVKDMLDLVQGRKPVFRLYTSDAAPVKLAAITSDDRPTAPKIEPAPEDADALATAEAAVVGKVEKAEYEPPAITPYTPTAEAIAKASADAQAGKLVEPMLNAHVRKHGADATTKAVLEELKPKRKRGKKNA